MSVFKVCSCVEVLHSATQECLPDWLLQSLFVLPTSCTQKDRPANNPFLSGILIRGDMNNRVCHTFKNLNFNFDIWIQIVSRCHKQAPTVEKLKFLLIGRNFYPFNFDRPHLKSIFFVPFIGFMVSKTTTFSLVFHHKKWFYKMCSDSWDIKKNVSKFSLPN